MLVLKFNGCKAYTGARPSWQRMERSEAGEGFSNGN